MRKENKIRISIAVGLTIALTGAIIAWAANQDTTIDQHSDRLGRIEVMQGVIVKDIDKIIVKQEKQDDKLDKILIEVVKKSRRR